MLLCLTASHRTAEFGLLERLSAAAPGVTDALRERGRERGDVRGAVVLATCNRFEVYLDSSALDSLQTVADGAGVDAAELRSNLQVLHGDDVVRHLFSVASGLESVVVGEDEISGQVARALEQAREEGLTSSALEQLFQKATATSRTVKTGTALGGAGRSLVRLALELADSRVMDWATHRVLLVGTGQYAATTVAALRDLGATDIRVYSASGRAAGFAAKHSLTAETSLDAAIDRADLVITCTTTERPVIEVGHVRPGRRLFVDLGMPRNVDSRVAEVAGAEVLDLETIKLHAPLEEVHAAAEAQELVRAAASDFSNDVEIGPSVVALRQHVEAVLQGELTRGRGASPEVAAALRHFAGVLLHRPSVRARELAAEGRAEEFTRGIDALFGLCPAEKSRRDAESATGEASA
ncbi:glutamyl-tRNA reductase [Ruicaihuangia caeni]|uniref:Glutamyl-tRNA reductase n=1 Tax=Ruicaihuangia caeni TaxID=3042517 RepID=A0AAW6T3P9_9MICO|nr:glutamyl-tRNA reductase [Klugiella sp. YN-L-19]MDI2098347.1 glutamyl-tRNA reductase [Klugiella sp. YN-L-19]